MPTVKVNGSSNSLCHKASGWFAQSTLPDVCKTPSPGGPVPVPYPVIVSLSSDLANGSTTVKADGGNMIAIKGCEFSRCTGDEPGTAGGVTSSTNMKEAKFILYSFDVKIDGKNACRLQDKMQMNHGNTMCLGGLGGAIVAVDSADLMPLKCDKDDLSDCDKKQICAKAAKFNEGAGQFKRRNKADMKAARAAGNEAAAAMRTVFEIAIRDGMMSREDVKPYFAHECAHAEWKKNGADPTFRNPHYSADHVHEIQLGGAPTSMTNLSWTSKKANEFLGGSLSHYDPTKHKGVKPDCC